MTARPTLCVLVLFLSACTPAPQVTQAEVQDFVRQYVAATNEADASKVMGLISREPTVSSVGFGKIYRGWDAIRTATDENIVSASRIKVRVGTIDVTPIGTDAALAVASMTLLPAQPILIGRNLVTEAPGAATIIVKRTPEGLRLIHEHYSLRAI